MDGANGIDYARKDDLKWISMIRLPVSEIMQISLVHIAQPVLKDGIVERSEIISCGLGA